MLLFVIHLFSVNYPSPFLAEHDEIQLLGRASFPSPAQSRNINASITPPNNMIIFSVCVGNSNQVVYSKIRFLLSSIKVSCVAGILML
jgi:hypothetical protein